MKSRTVRKKKGVDFMFEVFSNDGVKIYEFYFNRRQSQKFGPAAHSYLISMDGKKHVCNYSYFADMKRDAVSGWLEMGRISPIEVSI